RGSYQSAAAVVMPGRGKRAIPILHTPRSRHGCHARNPEPVRGVHDELAPTFGKPTGAADMKTEGISGISRMTSSGPQGSDDPYDGGNRVRPTRWRFTTDRGGAMKTGRFFEAALLAVGLMLGARTAVAQVITTLAGSGAIGSANGNAASASFSYPQGLAVDSAGNVYVA